MDPLSVSASIAGILTAVATATTFLGTLLSHASEAPEVARHILAEVTSIGSCLGQLQLFLSGTKESPISRISILTVDQVVVTLTGCMKDFSDLKRILDTLKTNEPSTGIEKIRWAMKEQSISRVLSRLQTSKMSLTLMLTTLSCISMAEARASCRELHDLVQQTLAGNQDIASRLKTLEVRHKARSTWEVGTQTSMDETLDDKSTIRPWNAADDRAITTIPFVPATPYTFTFEQDLQASRVYCRATRRNSALSHTSSIKDTVGWSVLSDLSLAQVSNISVFALPIAAAELYNYQDYEIRTREAGATSVSHHIEQAENKSVRVLILGNTKSGKSTIFKQFLLMSSEDSSWTRAYVKEAIRHVLEDSIHDMLACLNKIREDAIYPNYKYAWAILSGNNQSFKDKIRAVKVFWEDSSVKEVMYQQGYRKNDNLDYYLNELERLIDVNYVPSAQDALYLWIETTGICSQRMEIDQVTYNISDVGGHHTERKKWIHAFKNVDCIIFTVALSDYNTVTHGNATALHESLTLFESIVNSKWFTKSPCFLVFTKRDLFNKKLEFDPLWNYFPSYEGGDNNENAYRYLTEPFEKLKQKREIPFHILSASSVTSAGTIVRSIHEYLLRINKCIPSLSDEEYRSDRKRQTQRSWIAAAKELSFWADENHSVMADYNLWLKRSDVIRSEHIEVTKTMKVEFM